MTGHGVQLSVYLISTLLSLSLILFYIFKGKNGHLLYSFLFTQLCILLWSLRNFLDTLLFVYLRDIIHKLPSRYQIEYFLQVDFRFLSICFIGFSWFLFSLYYTKNRLTNLGWKLLFFALIPILCFAMAFTNRTHHLFFDPQYKPRIIFWIHAASSYLFTFTATVLLVLYTLRQRGYKKKQTVLLSTAIMIPLTVSIIQDFSMHILNKGWPIEGFDMVSLGFAFTSLVLTGIVFRYRFLNIETIALRRFLADHHQAIVCYPTY